MLKPLIFGLNEQEYRSTMVEVWNFAMSIYHRDSPEPLGRVCSPSSRASRDSPLRRYPVKWNLVTNLNTNQFTHSCINIPWYNPWCNHAGKLYIYPQVLLLADPLANMETSEYVERIDQVGTTTEAAAVSNGLSCLTKDVARTEVSQDTCKEKKRTKIFIINFCVCSRPIQYSCSRPAKGGAHNGRAMRHARLTN